ncbi:MAG: helix-turn-helix domain-containing protein [Lachnospiraceae bacterium]|nr:helix-turn-helix domain-containing protein [Lachnospiraceae bacterium]
MDNENVKERRNISGKCKRHCLYYCSAARPTIEGKTNEDSKEVQTETLEITSTPLSNGIVKVKTGANTEDSVYNGFKFFIYRPELQSDIPSVTLDVTLNGTEMAVLAILKQKPDSSRDKIADKISKTVRTVQRALDSLRDKGYIRRVGSKQNPIWEILK